MKAKKLFYFSDFPKYWAQYWYPFTKEVNKWWQKLHGHKQKTALAESRGVKSEGGMSPARQTEAELTEGLVNAGRRRAHPTGAGTCRVRGAFGINHSLVSFISRLRFKEKSFLLIQVWSGRCWTSLADEGREEMPPQENQKKSVKWVDAKPAPIFFSMLCLRTVSRARSPSEKAQLLTFEVKSSWNQRVRPRQHLGVTIWTRRAERGSLTTHSFLFQLVIEVKIKQT